MSGTYDAVVIGAGVIGAATTLGLARKGLQVLCLDRLPAAGYGSTSSSSAIIRPYYSTVDGCALGWESHFWWREWADFLGVADERGLARYVNCGCLRLKSPANGFLEQTVRLMDAIGCPYEHWSGEKVLERLPVVVLDSFGEPKRVDDPPSPSRSGRRCRAAGSSPTAATSTTRSFPRTTCSALRRRPGRPSASMRACARSAGPAAASQV